MATKNDDVVRSKFFCFHSARFVVIAKLKTKSSQKVGICEYKNAFPCRDVTGLNNSIDQNFMYI